jgi:ABC-type antimicrobial peptide transport system permease subunit
VDVGVALAASVVLAIAGVIAGIAPARLAARIQPVAALRAE